MKLKENQIEVLQRINDSLVYGDIREIAKACNKHRYTVGQYLSVNSDRYNQDIVDIAIARIAAREQSTKKSLTKISSN